MLYCKKCGVKVEGKANMCPLCQGELSGFAEGGNTFPNHVKEPTHFSLAIKILGMLSIAAILITAAINYSEYESFSGWWLYVAGAVVSFWIPFGIAYNARGNVSKSIIFTTLILCIIAFLWDLFTGYHAWSLDYILPISCCGAMLTMAIIARILNLQIEQYIYYLILDIVFALVPLVLLLCGVIDFIYPSVACIAASAISLISLFFFNGKALCAEIVRRTHL